MKDLTTKILAEFDERMAPWVAPFDEAMRFPQLMGEVKSFIAQALQRQLDEIRGRIEGMTLGGHRDEDKRIFAGGYDSAISDILAQLK